MRRSADMRPRRRGMSSRGRVTLIVVVAALVGLALSIRAIATFYTDYLWFDSVDATAVWRTQLGMEVTLVVTFTLLFFALSYGNLAVVDRLAPPFVARGPGDEVLDRYREIVGPRQRLVRGLVSGLFGIMAGAGAASQWENWLLFRHGRSFGIDDPLHGTDLSFYVFRLPFLSYLVSWMFTSLVIVCMLVAVSHYLSGSIRFVGDRFTVGPKVKAHMSVLLAALALVKAGDYVLARYRLPLSTRGVVDGALYSDINAQLPALTLLTLISLLSAGLFLANIRQKGWGLPMVAVGLWVLMGVIAGAAYPWFIQRFRVDPNPTALESEYIEHNIEATRAAMGMADVTENDFDYETDPGSEALTDNRGTVGNIRLLDPSIVGQTYSTLESKLDFYSFNDLDVDRYEIDGETTAVVLGTRELRPEGIPRDTWEARHLAYTHGYGVALAPANAVDSEGRPEFLVGDVPLAVTPGASPKFELDRPEIYFGQDMDRADSYAIVRTNIDEQSGRDSTRYEGTGGVQLNSTLRKAAFSLRFGQIDPLISDQLTEESRMVFVRDVDARVRKVAPFLEWDSDPYPVLSDGRIRYIVDGYTTTSSYPYAQRAVTEGLSATSQLRGEDFNYLRNSVKAVVDAYDGSIDMYLTDELYGEQDPIIQAYARAFPDLFLPFEEMPEVLTEHLRYPEDMFRVQSSMWGRYHINDPNDFYRQDDGWDVAQKPPSDVDAGAGFADGSSERIDPFYLMMTTPSEDESEFVLFRPFVAHSEPDSTSPKKQLTSFMVGRSDLESYGQLETYTMTSVDANGDRERNRDVDGPLNVHERIVSDTTSGASQEITQLNVQGGGSKVEFGNMLIVPVDQGLLYVRPLYVRGDSEGSPPLLRRVLVDIGGNVEIGDTLAEALTDLYPDAEVVTREAGIDEEEPVESTPDEPDVPDGSTSTTTTTPPTVDDEIDDLILDAIALFNEADQVLRDGGAESFGEYQAKVSEAEAKIERAGELLTAGGASAARDSGSATTTTTTP